ncbi:MAG: porin [Acetobacter aceti]|uniref:Porin n=1 Tax=Acetobacter aceti TaxID=435 RepID=A0A1U9KJY7_ACEAC|nr:porin [Acetobacter aceti]AQS86110.1 hypothetical protein A0U92_16645 [Acetobacter aceti]
MRIQKKSLRNLLLSGGTASLFWSAQAMADTGGVDVRALAELVKSQAKQIQALQSRLDAIEHSPARKAPAPSPHHQDVAEVTQAHVRMPIHGDTQTTPSMAAKKSTSDPDVTPVFNDTTMMHATSTASADAGLSSYPLTAAAPGTSGAVSAMPSGSSPVYGVESSIPYSSHTTTVRGLVLKWGRGLPAITTPDGLYSIRIRGRILADYGASFGSDYHNQNVSRTRLRAARLGVEGRAKQLSWVFEADFADNTPTIMSAFATWSMKFGGHLTEFTLGNKFNERGFDGSTGSDATVFLDRDLVANTIVPVKGWYGLGGAFKIFGESWHFVAQISGDDVNSVNSSNNLRDDLTYEARAHWIPYRSKESLIHLGAWGFYEDVKPTAQFTQNIRLLARTDDAFSARINTTPLANSLAGGAEFFAIWKTAWLLGEYGARHMQFRRTYDGADMGGHAGTIQAASLQAGIFLTGETPNYFAHTGQWASPRVLSPVLDGGPGAWEVAMRGDWMDAKDVPSGGNAWVATAGVNWYLVNYARLMLNYSHAHVNNRTSPYPGVTGGNIVGMRAGITF